MESISRGSYVFVERVVETRACISCFRKPDEDLVYTQGWVSVTGSKGYPLMRKIRTRVKRFLFFSSNFVTLNTRQPESYNTLGVNKVRFLFTKRLSVTFPNLELYFWK